MKRYFLRVCLVLLFIFMFSVLVFGEKVENVKIEILEWGNNGVIYKITNNDTVPIKWYKVRMTLEYEKEIIVSSIKDANYRDRPTYDTVKRQKHVYAYGPDNPIKPGESVEVFFKLPPLPTSKFSLNKNTVKITCNSEQEAFPTEPSNLKIKPAVWIVIILLGLVLAFK